MNKSSIYCKEAWGMVFRKTSVVNLWIILEVYPEFCLQLQFFYNLAIHILKRTTFV